MEEKKEINTNDLIRFIKDLEERTGMKFDILIPPKIMQEEPRPVQHIVTIPLPCIKPNYFTKSISMMKDEDRSHQYRLSKPQFKPIVSSIPKPDYVPSPMDIGMISESMKKAMEESMENLRDKIYRNTFCGYTVVNNKTFEEQLSKMIDGMTLLFTCNPKDRPMIEETLKNHCFKHYEIIDHPYIPEGQIVQIMDENLKHIMLKNMREYNKKKGKDENE